ncbi:glutaredoxin family protein [Aquabacterium sp.]|uniref:glutaredoxin family protein n=1 Tax=Aquabacterium sp. TaxID=1872578 RepID=UPI0035B2BFD5
MKQTPPRWRAILSATILTLIVLIPSVVGVYGFAYRDRLFPVMSTVVVYGRETCGITKIVRSGLDAKHIPYVFADIDIRAIKDELNYKLGPRFNEPSYTLPVVHVGGKLLLTPTSDEVEQAAQEAASLNDRDYKTLLNGADPAPHY